MDYSLDVHWLKHILKVVAIIDIDCTEADGFDHIDEKQLQSLAELIGESCDWAI